ncbi:MAG: M20/M25/M40 family metallo-hydrolase [Paludibacteraceae bacterium]|nr:M20/M25/M40 family metallo-hydrolase [Paludibacteraceae bacterium]
MHYNNDLFNNLITHHQGNGQTLMLIAHADVVKMMVTYIDESGFIYVKPYGGIDVNILPCRQVEIHHGDTKVVGIIGKKPIHLQREETGNLSWENIWIDIAAKNKAEATAMVSIGDYVYYQPSRIELPNNYMSGSGLDNSCGVQVMNTVAEALKDKQVNLDLYYVASNYEEIGMRGARVAANTIKPEICIIIDVTHATDYPGMNPIMHGDIKLGRGCVLAMGPHVDEGIYSKLKHIAEQNNIAYQIEPSPNLTGTEASVVQVSNEGVRTAVVSIPCRYMHTPYEMVSKDDIDSAIKLIQLFIEKS